LAARRFLIRHVRATTKARQQVAGWSSWRRPFPVGRLIMRPFQKVRQLGDIRRQSASWVATKRPRANGAAEANPLVHLIRLCQPVKQSLQLLFARLPPFEMTAQPSHYRRYARLSRYVSTAIFQCRRQEAPFGRLQRARSAIGWKFTDKFGHARNRGNSQP
jgi:hypothetical protein